MEEDLTGGAEVAAAEEDEGGSRAEAVEAARVNSWRWWRPAVELLRVVDLLRLARALPAEEEATSGDDCGDRFERGERSCAREWRVVERSKACRAPLSDRWGRGEAPGVESAGEAAATVERSPLAPCSRWGEAAVTAVRPASSALMK